MGALGTLAGIIWLIIIIAGILAVLMPFFVLRIRNEMIKLNENMSKIIELLSGKRGTPESTDKGIKMCPHCGRENRQEDSICLSCGKALV
jgi:hypothetical protein